MFRNFAFILLVLIAGSAPSLQTLGLSAHVICESNGIKVAYVDETGAPVQPVKATPGCECPQTRDGLDGWLSVTPSTYQTPIKLLPLPTLLSCGSERLIGLSDIRGPPVV